MHLFIHKNLRSTFDIFLSCLKSPLLSFSRKYYLTPTSDHICYFLTPSFSSRWLTQEKDLPQGGLIQQGVANVVLDWIHHTYQHFSSYATLGTTIICIALNLYWIKKITPWKWTLLTKSIRPIPKLTAPIYLWSINFWQRKQEHTMEKRWSLQQALLRKLDSYN